ncbi:NADP oxidoreductase coenzyme F420-dependent [Novymonas esmeraldas]|uniref:NADP oxidoreductase coenzyme F420-dependent n=1 Tax=Novymonas esmeraldas TaxID=1808958 RepID=A0AAW0F624_9TRYP
MNADYALLLNTVLAERGCTDASLQRTAETVPLVYRTLAEHNFYLLHLVSVVKALLHEEDAAFAHMARLQAQRHTSPTADAAAVTTTSSTLSPHIAVAAVVPPLAPSDSLDMQLTIVGGGTCCELMLRLICGCGRTGGGGVAATSTAVRAPLVHPSHITVVTRQPERLMAFAEMGVHCLARHHGRRAAAQSDVVVLACPPAQLKEVTRDLFAVAADAATEVATSTAATAAATTGTADAPLLQPNTVLISCMAGVPVRKVAQSFQHFPLRLTYTPSLHTFGACVPFAATAPPPPPVASPPLQPYGSFPLGRFSDRGSGSSSRGGGGGGGSSTASSSSSTVYSPTRQPPPLPTAAEAAASAAVDGAVSSQHASLEEAGACFTTATAMYRSARIAEMRSSTSFLRPAVLQRAAEGAKAAAAAREAALSRGQPPPVSLFAGGGATYPPAAAPPRLTDFTAGRHPSTSPTLDEYLDLWQTLQAYVRATFAKEATTTASRSRGRGRAGDGYGGLVSVVVPHTSAKHHRMSDPGEVEAELLPALVLLPAAQTRALWDAWWGNTRRGGHAGGGEMAADVATAVAAAAAAASRGGGDAAPATTAPTPASTSSPLSAALTAVTGAWLCRVYANVGALKEDLDEQFNTVVSARTR